jgi:hypothetical protein
VLPSRLEGLHDMILKLAAIHVSPSFNSSIFPGSSHAWRRSVIIIVTYPTYWTHDILQPSSYIYIQEIYPRDCFWNTSIIIRFDKDCDDTFVDNKQLFVINDSPVWDRDSTCIMSRCGLECAYMGQHLVVRHHEFSHHYFMHHFDQCQ